MIPIMAANRITSVELHTRLGAVIDRAVVNPVTITKHGRDHLVMLSAERYAALTKAAANRGPSQLTVRVGTSRSRTTNAAD